MKGELDMSWDSTEKYSFVASVLEEPHAQWDRRKEAPAS